MRIKREFKKLLNDRKQKLRFVIMDQQFYRETNAKLLSLNVEELKDRIVKVEAKMKKIENYKGKDAIEKKVRLKRQYESTQEVIKKVMDIRQRLSNLVAMEEDLNKYILFLEAYIGLKRWK